MLSTLGNPSFGYKVLLPIIAILLAAPLLSGPGGTPPPGEEVMFDVTWGDDSGSQSESYTLSIPNAQPSTLPKSIPGELMTKPLALRKGKSYTLTMNHVRTTLKNAPDYDYTLRVDGKGGNVITVLDKGVGGTWLLYDKNSIGGVHSESNEFYAAGRELLLVPVDLDIVHPATGEFAENKENVGDGGYLSIERDATTPRTGLLIKSNTALGAAGGKYRLKFANGTRYQIYQDYARTQPVLSEQTEFDANVPHALHLHGLQKSLTRGGEKITLQAWWSGRWIDTDEIKLTVVQSEFLIQVKAFIPYAWTEAEKEIPGPNFLNPLNGKVVAGDYDAADRPSFKNIYSNDKLRADGGFFDDAPFRVCQTVIITPYEDIHATPDIVLKRALMTAPLSEHFVKATSVHPSEMSLEHGYLTLSGTHSSSGKPPTGTPTYTLVSRTGKTSELTLHGSGTDGAMGSILGVPIEWFTADIQWTLTLKIKADSNPLAPEIEYAGEHDSFPAYEIIVIQSDGTYKDVHRFAPPPSAKPGPESLNDDNALTIGHTDTITQ